MVAVGVVVDREEADQARVVGSAVADAAPKVAVVDAEGGVVRVA